MIAFLQTGKALSVFVAIGLIGIVSKLITRSLYKRLVKETDNMAMTKNKNLKVLKQKLENAYRLNQNIVNTQAYLDKQVYGFKFMKVSLNGWNNLSQQMTILGLLAGGAASFMSYWYRLDSYYIILYASVGALGSLLLTFLDSSFNISMKQQRLSNALLEYTDNSVFVRAVRENGGRDAVRDFAATSREISGKVKNAERKADRNLDRNADAGGRDQDPQDSEGARDMLIRENDIRDGLVREEDSRSGFPRSLRGRNVKAEELLRTVRNMKDDSMDAEAGVESCDAERGSRHAREPLARRGVPSERKQNGAASSQGEGKTDALAGRYSGVEREANTEVRRDIDYLKHSLEQIAVSKEKNRISDDWAKNLDAEELKVIGEIMRQYFAGN